MHRPLLTSICMLSWVLALTIGYAQAFCLPSTSMATQKYLLQPKVQPTLFDRATRLHSHKRSSRLDAGKNDDEGSNQAMVHQHEYQPTSTPLERRDLLKRSITACALSIATCNLVTDFIGTDSVAYAKETTLSEEYRQGTMALDKSKQSPPDNKDPVYQKLPSGVIYADLRPGTGTQQVTTGSRVNLQWVLRRSNGYFVDSSERQDSVPFIFTVGDKTAIAGLDEGVKGMTVGQTRRLLIPPSLAYVQGLDDGCPGPLPSGFGPRQQMRRVQAVRANVPGEYVYLEVQLTRLR
jgi:FKBP-type peptidyl-prolyl cis-trans isomerase